MKKAFDPFNHFGFLTHRVATLLDLRMQPKLKEKGFDFPTSCLGILVILWSGDGVTQTKIGCSLVKNKSSINKMLKALEENGLIEKRDDPKDKRNKLIFLTELGKAFQSTVEESTASIHEGLVKSNTEEEIAITKKVLKNFYINLKNKITNDLNNE